VAAGCVIDGAPGSGVVLGSDRPIWPATSRAEPVLPGQREGQRESQREGGTAGTGQPVVVAPRVGAGVARDGDSDSGGAGLRDAVPAARRSTGEARSGDAPPRPAPRQLRSPTSVSREATPGAGRDANPDATTDATTADLAPAAPVAGVPPVNATAAEPLTTEPPATDPDRRGRGSRLTAVLLSVLALLVAGAAVLFVTYGPGAEPNDDPESRSGTTPATTPGPSFPTWPVRYTDSLDVPRGWSPTTEPSHRADCTFRDKRLEIEMRKGGIFRCQGQRDELTDFALRVDVYLLDGRSCAGIWFRRRAHERDQDSGYLLKVCPTELVLGHHHADGKIEDFRRFPVADIAPGAKVRVGLVVRRNEIGLYLNDAFVGRDGDTLYPDGRVALGIAVPQEVGAGRIGFANIELRTP
jgi:hypothetical protein